MADDCADAEDSSLSLEPTKVDLESNLAYTFYFAGLRVLMSIWGSDQQNAGHLGGSAYLDCCIQYCIWLESHLLDNLTSSLYCACSDCADYLAVLCMGKTYKCCTVLVFCREHVHLHNVFHSICSTV